LKHKDKNNVLIVKYEDFTENPKVTLAEITEFLNIQYESFMLDSNDSIYRKIHQQSNMKIREEQVNKPIKPNRGGWQKVFSEEQASEIASRVADLAAALGYGQTLRR